MLHCLKSEADILRCIVSDTQILANTIYFVLDTAFPHPGHAFAQDIVLAMNVPRTALGLDASNKPGDIDYLIIPFKGEQFIYDRTIAVEVKVVRPSLKKPSRNTNSMGRSQVLGLLRDGFPVVGLLHVSIPETLPESLLWRVPLISNKLGPKGEVVKTGKYISVDPFPIISAERQEGRLVALNLPSEVAFKAIGYSLSRKKIGFAGSSANLEHRGLVNPDANSNLIDNVALYFSSRPELFLTIRWYNKK